jgi:hypothetical protein
VAIEEGFSPGFDASCATRIGAHVLSMLVTNLPQPRRSNYGPMQLK